MIDVYEIRFKDSDNCTIRICQEDEKGNEVEQLNVCLKYKDSWSAAISEHITSFFKKHPIVKTFEETKDTMRMMTVYSFITEDGSRLKVDAIDKVKEMSEIIAAKKHS